MRVRRGQQITADQINQQSRRAHSNVVQGAGMSRIQQGDTITLTSGAVQRGGGGGLRIPLVAVLPPVPTDSPRMVLWGTSEQIAGGTGDGQIWAAAPGQDRWHPAQGVYTRLSGVPV